MNPDTVATLKPCPACEACTTCRGTGEIMGVRSGDVVKRKCPADAICGLCDGARLCTATARTAWLNATPTEPPPRAA